MTRKKLKISKVLPNDRGTICGECGHKNHINAGMSVAYKNGNVHFWCEQCGKETMMDKKAPWARTTNNKKRRKR